jgi:TusE/DsrC/DsvC family sulfur relay protein
MPRKKTTEFYPTSPEKWRTWLEGNHSSEQSVWLLFYKVSSDKPSLTWSEAVDEALCFGWIDSTKKSIDKEKYKQLFCQRKPKSTWSKVNKDKVEVLSNAGKIQAAGWKSIEIAKENEIEMTDRHWEVIDYLHDKHKKEETLSIRGIKKSGVVDIKEFYELFPKGPLKVSTKIAGIPKPKSCI